MHRLLLRHGLIQNIVASATHRSPLLRISPRIQIRTLTGGRHNASPNETEPSIHNGPAPTSQEHVRAQHHQPRLWGERIYGTVTESAEDNGRHALAKEPKQGCDRQVAGVPEVVEPVSYPARKQDPDETVDKQSPEQQAEDKSALPERKYLRNILHPKRFPPLLREVKRVGKDHLISGSGRTQKSLDRSAVSTEVLEAELRWVSRNYPHPKAVREILKILIQDRKVKPSAIHYEALILANCFPELGSVDNVKMILEEMEREGILVEPSIYYAVLTVLTVHPDTYLRTTIIEKLRQQWISIPEYYAQLNVVAMIREGQLELATVELDNLQQKAIPIPAWVWVIYIHAICDRHDFEALLQVLYKVSDEGFLIPRPTLLHILTTASELGSLDVTKYIWHGFVESMHIMPNEDLCMTVLRLAVKNSDRKLAESVAIVLESVAGDKFTTPPSLTDKPAPTKHELMSLTFDSPDLLGFDFDAKSHTSHTHHLAGSAGDTTRNTTSASTTASTERDDVSESLAMAFSTPLPLPHPSIRLQTRKLPDEAVDLLCGLGIDTDRRGRNRPRPGILYPLFRKESGLRGARFDPRLALMQGWDWRKK